MGVRSATCPRRKREFESIISSFLLTFHDFQQDDYNDSALTQGSCDHALRTKQQLLLLKGGEGTQLIMMLHGMGGSGKNTVIALVILRLFKSTAKIFNTHSQSEHCCDRFVRRPSQTLRKKMQLRSAHRMRNIGLKT
jgi:hypothetical protein